MENFEKGSKRKCTKCSTLFFDFGKHPIICPACGADVNSLLTNVSRRGRPPKNSKPDETEQNKEIKMDEIEVAENGQDIDSDESNVEDEVEDIVEIDREEES
tara:strand:+ start:286 stop:591 length:306 start_codon:yes stop_codon:yes gene_type:complete